MFNDGFLLHNAIKTQLSRTKKGLALISKLNLQIKTFMAGKSRVKFSFFHLNFIAQLASIRWFRVYAYTGILLHLQQRALQGRTLLEFPLRDGLSAGV